MVDAIPDSDGIVRRARGEQGRVGIEIQRPDRVRVAGKARELLGSCNVPQNDGAVLASASKILSILGKGEGMYRPGVADEDSDGIACLHVPEADGLVRRSRGDVVRVRMELHRVNVARVTAQDPQRNDPLRAPDPGRPVLRSRSEIIVERPEPDVPNWEIMALVADEVVRPLLVQPPEPHRGVLRSAQQPVRIGREGDPENGTAVADQLLIVDPLRVSLALLLFGIPNAHHRVRKSPADNARIERHVHAV